MEVLKPVPHAMAIFGTGHRPESISKDVEAWRAYAWSALLVREGKKQTAFKSGSNPNRWVKLEVQLINMLTEATKKVGPIVVITGAQRGMDLVLANAACLASAFTDKVYHVLAIPFQGFDDTSYWKWTDVDRALLGNLQEFTDRCGMVVKLHDTRLKKGEHIAGRLFNERNQFMVDLAIALGQPACIALFNGNKGGTANCVNYAKKQRMADNRFIVFRPTDLSYTKNGNRYLECSTAGYGPSAMTSVIETNGKGVRSIEDIYQDSKLDGNKKPLVHPKGNKNVKYIDIGGKAEPFTPELLSTWYRYLWDLWMITRDEGKAFLANIGDYDVYTDMYSRGSMNSQAKVFQDIRDNNGQRDWDGSLSEFRDWLQNR